MKATTRYTTKTKYTSGPLNGTEKTFGTNVNFIPSIGKTVKGSLPFSSDYVITDCFKN